jgi:hypothetical protein
MTRYVKLYGRGVRVSVSGIRVAVQSDASFETSDRSQFLGFALALLRRMRVDLPSERFGIGVDW